MNTFLPYPDYAKSARVLDRQRLGKQRIETYQILLALTKEEYGWKRHPATLMWQGHEYQLAKYGVAVCDEWIARGYNDTMREKFLLFLKTVKGKRTKPKWFGDRAFHRAMQSNLVRKDPAHYRKFFKRVPDDLPYTWGKLREK
jgi:hypothetical protein